MWVSNVTAEVNTFRIPLITFTPKGSLLAFCEARKFSYNDMEAKFFAVKRSVDKGGSLYYSMLDWIQSSETGYTTTQKEDGRTIKLRQVEGLGVSLNLYLEHHPSPWGICSVSH